MKITGELLKTERLKLNLTHQDIAASLKLSAKTIQFIEDGDLENLPAKTFVRGFVKSYAELLKLDSKLVLNQYHEEVGFTQPKSKIVNATPPPVATKAKSASLDETAQQNKNISTIDPQFKSSFNTGTLKTIALILALVLVLGLINQVINKYQKEVQNADETVELKETSAEIAPEAVSTAVTTPATTDALKTELTPTTAVTSTTPTSSEATPPVTTAPAATEATPAPAPEVKPSPVVDAKPVELVLEALKDTKVMYSVGNDTTYKTIELKKDTFQIIKSKSGLKIKVEEGNSVNITVNGKNKGPAASDAKPISLSF